MEKFSSAAQAVAVLQPHKPVICLRPHAVQAAVAWFGSHFEGTCLYAVKANNHPLIIQTLYDCGIRAFDVAALDEIKQLSAYEDVQLYYMNPFKPRWMIKQAFHDYNVRDFVLDSASELKKIIEETGATPDQINLHVRLSMPNPTAAVPLAGKFGVPLEEADALLIEAAKYTNKLGISFHVGSQCLDPESYSFAIQLVDQIVEHTDLTIHSLDVGGGFPVEYDNFTQPGGSVYMNEIHAAKANSQHLKKAQLLAEPGRGLAAEAESVIVQIIHRGGQKLTLNDGAFGCMFEGSDMYYGLVYPVRALMKTIDHDIMPFALQGPTCDSTDTLSGVYHLPATINEGDYIEIGNTGAYGHVLASRFNGFGDYDYIELTDAPMMSRYDHDAADFEDPFT